MSPLAPACRLGTGSEPRACREDTARRGRRVQRASGDLRGQTRTTRDHASRVRLPSAGLALLKVRPHLPEPRSGPHPRTASRVSERRASHLSGRHAAPRRTSEASSDSRPSRLPYLTGRIGHPRRMATPDRYGPHDPTTQPTHVVEVSVKRNSRTLYLRKPARVGQYGDADLVDVFPAVLLRQRQQINRLARGEPLTGLRSELCGVCARPEWQCLSMRRGAGDAHEYEPPRRVR